MNKYIQINRYLSKYICVCIDKDRILYESYPNILPKKANNYSIGDPASLYKSLLMFYQASNLPHFASPTEVSSGIDRRLEMSGEPPPPNSLLPPRKCPVGSTKRLGMSGEPLPTPHFASPTEVSSGIHRRLGISGEMTRKFSNCICLVSPTQQLASPTEVSSGIHKKIGDVR